MRKQTSASPIGNTFKLLAARELLLEAIDVDRSVVLTLLFLPLRLKYDPLHPETTITSSPKNTANSMIFTIHHHSDKQAILSSGLEFRNAPHSSEETVGLLA